MKNMLEKILPVFTDSDTYKYKRYCDWSYVFVSSHLSYELSDDYPTCFHRYILKPPLLH